MGEQEVCYILRRHGWGGVRRYTSSLVPKLGDRCPQERSSTNTQGNKSGNDCDELDPDWLNPVQISSKELR